MLGPYLQNIFHSDHMNNWSLNSYSQTETHAAAANRPLRFHFTNLILPLYLWFLYLLDFEKWWILQKNWQSKQLKWVPGQDIIYLQYPRQHHGLQQREARKRKRVSPNQAIIFHILQWFNYRLSFTLCSTSNWSAPALDAISISSHRTGQLAQLHIRRWPTYW